jgi:hypothetical protein
MPSKARTWFADGSSCTAVIDLADGAGPEYGGYDARARQIFYPLAVRGRLRIGHTRSLSDPDAPILIDPRDTIYPGAAGADLRCGECIAKVDIGELDGDTLAVLGHEPGCAWLAAALTEAGLS